MNKSSPVVILIAEDDPDDRLLVRDALEASRLANPINFVDNGEELMDYLNQKGVYEKNRAGPRPGLILLDLNMPRKDGRQALEEIKADPELRCIPTVVLTTSEAEEDILSFSSLGVSGFITKPVSFVGMVEVMRAIGKYWLQIVELV